MSIYQYAQPASFNRFHENTEKQKVMPGVSMPSFVCRGCGKSKTTHGRKSVIKGTSKFGYNCRDCVK